MAVFNMLSAAHLQGGSYGIEFFWKKLGANYMKVSRVAVRYCYRRLIKFLEALMDISNIPVAELKSLLAQIPKEIERREKEEKLQVRKEIIAFAAERGFALSDLVDEAPAKKARTPVAVKYKHPSDSTLVWTGRGRQPKWVVSFLANGGTLGQLLV
jgi:DNA-binding protein H-NS